ncbi:Casparian strip membrane protein domain [Sesbania bispinosa]|nr:Casparian strip membrane protein domain [Sesbania bispinosa]
MSHVLPLPYLSNPVFAPPQLSSPQEPTSSNFPTIAVFSISAEHGTRQLGGEIEMGVGQRGCLCYLIASMGLQVIWSFVLALLDAYALLRKKVLHNPVLVSLFVVGDWVTAILSLAAASSSAGITVLYFNDLGHCHFGDECQKIAEAIFCQNSLIQQVFILLKIFFECVNRKGNRVEVYTHSNRFLHFNRNWDSIKM